MLGKEERKCAVCGELFSARSADVRRGWAKCCSKSCAATKNNRKTGNYQRYMSERRSGGEFDDAHLFSNEDHDCNKDF